ncbi:hypothetical protein HMPREF0262_00699 [Clostridium sp. ATCC 29733]|nr:hypothetical protein HMPREF0262_00699 [Clostridium sp. ATCC 29733]
MKGLSGLQRRLVASIAAKGAFWRESAHTRSAVEVLKEPVWPGPPYF